MTQPVAIITGAGRGIGRAIAGELARRGYRLTLVARTEKELHETHQHFGGDALISPCDVTDPAVVERVVAQTHEKFGRIDALVNNAGAAPVLPVEQTTPEEWRRVIDTNLSAAFYFVRAVWSIMKRQGGGA